ncbi:hypothetical protein QJQ45_026844 [Haematococcus lacustris]|nr:hypothetical protein QJQ45_026844 [Haematococcus lacustris]
MGSQVLGSYIVPRLVQEKLQHGIATSRHATAAGIDGRWCWVYCHDTVLLWQYQQGADARMRTLRLPPNVTRSSLLGIFVSVLVSASDSCLTVLVCTGSGQLVAWLDANNLADPFVHQLTSHLGSPAHGSSPAITSFSAAAPAQASSPGFTAAVCSADGCVFIVEGSPLGLHEQRLSAPAARPTQSSVLGSLGHVMAWTYSEAFAPGQKFLKTKSSGRPARAVNLVSRDMSHLHLLIMTDETLECWLLTQGLRPSQQLLWSWQSLLAARSEVGVAAAANCALAVAGQQAALLVQGPAGPAGQGQQAALVHRLQLNIESGPVHDHCLQLQGVVSEVRGAAVGGPPAAPGLPLSVEGRQQVGQLLDSVLGQAAAALAAQPAGASPAAAVLGIAAGLRRRLDSLGALSPSSNAGVVADFSTGLLDRLPKQWAMAGQQAMQGGGGGSAGQLASLLSEKEQRHSLLLLILAEAGVLHSLPPAVLRSLLENAEKLGVVSSLLGLHGAAVREQQASAAAPQGQEPLIGQVVCAAGRSVSCQAAGQQSLAPAEVFYAQPSLSGPQLLLALARAAGQVAEQAGSGFTAAAAYGAGELREQAVDLGRLVGCIMAAALRQRSALHASHGLSASQVYSQLGHPSWLAGQEARACFHAVAKACQAVRQLLLGPSFAGIPRGSSLSPALLQLARTHFAVADVLLNAYSAAVAAAGEGDSKQCLLSEYRAVRGSCLATLLLDALAELDGAQELQAEPDLLIWQVEQLAAGHHCYPQLYEVCGALGARLGPGGRPASASSNPRLHQHMASVGAEDGAAEQDTFARFVYQRLLEDQQPAELLQLPAFFTADLTAFLRLLPGQASLLWPLLLRTGQWGEAAEAAEQQADATQSSNLKQARLLAIAKLARLASQEVSGSQVEQLSTRLQLLRLQTSLSQLRQHTAPAGGAGAGGGGAAAWAAAGLERDVMGGPGPKGGVREEEAVLDLVGLVEAALGEEGRGAGGAGALLALEALALQPPQVMKAHRRYVQEAWRLVLGASDWAGLAAELATADPDACEAAMQRTPLHQARTRQARGGGGEGGGVDGTGHSLCVGGQGGPAVLLCSGHGAFGHSASVEDSGPLQEVVAWLRQWTRADPNAQARAMQHASLLCKMLMKGAAAASVPRCRPTACKPLGTCTLSHRGTLSQRRLSSLLTADEAARSEACTVHPACRPEHGSHSSVAPSSSDRYQSAQAGSRHAMCLQGTSIRCAPRLEPPRAFSTAQPDTVTEADMEQSQLDEVRAHEVRLMMAEAMNATVLSYRVPEYKTSVGNYLAIVGSIEEVGSWSAHAGARMKWSPGNSWACDVILPESYQGTFEYKVVLLNDKGMCVWEPGPNRKLHVPGPGAGPDKRSIETVLYWGVREPVLTVDEDEDINVELAVQRTAEAADLLPGRNAASVMLLAQQQMADNKAKHRRQVTELREQLVSLQQSASRELERVQSRMREVGRQGQLCHCGPLEACPVLEAARQERGPEAALLCSSWSVSVVAVSVLQCYMPHSIEGVMEKMQARLDKEQSVHAGQIALLQAKIKADDFPAKIARRAATRSRAEAEAVEAAEASSQGQGAVMDVAAMAAYFPHIMAVLPHYSGLSVQRLHAMLAKVDQQPRYHGNEQALAQYLHQLVAENKLTVDNGIFRFKSRTGTPPSARRGSPRPARPPSPPRPAAAAAPPAPQAQGATTAPAPRTASPRAVRTASPTPARASTRSGTAGGAELQPKVVQVLSSYAGLTLERLLGMVRASASECTPQQLTAVMRQLESNGLVTQERGVYRYRPSSAPAQTPSGTRGRPQPASALAHSLSTTPPRSPRSSTPPAARSPRTPLFSRLAAASSMEEDDRNSAAPQGSVAGGPPGQVSVAGGPPPGYSPAAGPVGSLMPAADSTGAHPTLSSVQEAAQPVLQALLAAGGPCSLERLHNILHKSKALSVSKVELAAILKNLVDQHQVQQAGPNYTYMHI